MYDKELDNKDFNIDKNKKQKIKQITFDKKTNIQRKLLFPPM